MKIKRTPAQLEFDAAKHGWAFCDPPQLTAYLERLEPIAARLEPDDERHATLAQIRTYERANR